MLAKRRAFAVIGAAVAAVATTPLEASAGSLTAVAYSGYADVGSEFGNTAQRNVTGSGGTFVEQVAPYTDYYGPANATVTLAITPFPSITADLTASNLATANAKGTIDYYFKVVGPANNSIPITISQTGSLSSDFVSGSFVAVAFGFGLGYTGYACVPAPSCGSGDTFTGAAPETVAANVPYHIGISLQLGLDPDSYFHGGGFTQTATAFVDPIVSFGPHFDSTGYSLEFSDGVGNSLPATPLPATLPLFVSGLGAIVLLGRRRRKP